MSFGRLLAAGKSWVGGDAIGRYRMQKHILLPKFISPRNPFKSEAPQEAPLLPVVMPAATPVVETAEGAGVVMHRVSWPARAGAGLRRLSLFCLDHNPFGRIGQAKRPAIPRFGRSGVQGELSLDKVKVLRNDLAHADLEVVQVGAGGDQAATPAWKNLTARIFGAGLK